MSMVYTVDKVYFQLTNLNKLNVETLISNQLNQKLKQVRHKLLIEEGFLVFYIAGGIGLLLTLGLIAMASKPAGKLIAPLVTLCLLIVSVWWICLSYKIDDL
jgi:hypothetical protein